MRVKSLVDITQGAVTVSFDQDSLLLEVVRPGGVYEVWLACDEGFVLQEVKASDAG